MSHRFGVPGSGSVHRLLIFCLLLASPAVAAFLVLYIMRVHQFVSLTSSLNQLRYQILAAFAATVLCTHLLGFWAFLSFRKTVTFIFVALTTVVMVAELCLCVVCVQYPEVVKALFIRDIFTHFMLTYNELDSLATGIHMELAAALVENKCCVWGNDTVMFENDSLSDVAVDTGPLSEALIDVLDSYFFVPQDSNISLEEWPEPRDSVLSFSPPLACCPAIQNSSDYASVVQSLNTVHAVTRKSIDDRYSDRAGLMRMEFLDKFPGLSSCYNWENYVHFNTPCFPIFYRMIQEDEEFMSRFTDSILITLSLAVMSHFSCIALSWAALPDRDHHLFGRSFYRAQILHPD